MNGVYFLRIFLLLTVVPGWIFLRPPTGVDLDAVNFPAFESWVHPLGCDRLGRDVYALYSYGVLSTLILAIPARVLTLVFSIVMALLSYILGKIVGYFLDQISYVFLAVPSLFIALLVVAGWGASLWSLPVAIVLSDWAFCYESIQARIREIRNSPYVSLSRAMGAGKLFIFQRHIIPGLFTMVWFLFLTGVPTVIMSLALFSFLGVDPSGDLWGPGLGEQIAFSADYFDRNPWAVYTPILGIVFMVMGLGKK